MGQMREDELEAMAERDADEREEEEFNQIQELIVCHTVSDLKTFLMKHLIGV